MTGQSYCQIQPTDPRQHRGASTFLEQTAHLPKISTVGKDAEGCTAPLNSAWVEAIVSRADLERYKTDWQMLAKVAIEPNIFYEPWQLLPAIDAFGAGKDSIFLFIFQHDRQHQKILIGFFPFERTRAFRGWPARILAAWRHPYSYLSTPLLHRDFAKQAWRAARRWARSDPRGANLLEFPLLLAEGPSHNALIEACYCDNLISYEVDHLLRAALHPSPEGGEAYLRAAISGGKRKELRRQKRRLSDLGPLTTRILEPTHSIDPWIEDFLELEASGWKGKASTAFLSRSNATEYFRTICREAHSLGRLHMLALVLNDRPIAMKCNFISDSGSFSLKIAYDEQFRRYSPGVLLELENIVEVHRRKTVRWMDSCAEAQHPMIDGLWKERRAIRHLLISPRSPKGNLTLALFLFGRALRRRYRERVSAE